MNTLLLGKNGQVGWDLQGALPLLSEMIVLDCHGENGHYCDPADLKGLRSTACSVQRDALVNAVNTAVDKAKSDTELAQLINAQASMVLAEEIRRLGSWLVHCSTDYVFDDSGNRPWRETDAVAPLNHYRQSKLQREQAIQALACNHLYGSRSNSLAKTMLWIPEGFAHGFVALEDDTHFLYKTTDYYSKDYEAAIRWDDPPFRD